MEEKKEYFREALADFTHDVAYGRAVAHLASLGYTVKQIRERLDYPVSEYKVSREFCFSLEEEGRVSFVPPFTAEKKSFEILSGKNQREILKMLETCSDKNSKGYVCIPYFKEDLQIRMEMERVLTGREIDYLEGFFYRECAVYHCLDERMLQIAAALYAGTKISISFWFPEEKRILGRVDR